MASGQFPYPVHAVHPVHPVMEKYRPQVIENYREAIWSVVG